MKIFRSRDSKVVPKEGFDLNVVAEVLLGKEVTSVGFFRPVVPPNGKLRNHYHERLVEFMCFESPARIKVGSEVYDLSPGDLVMIPPGEAHEVFAGEKGASMFVVKLPNDPQDTKVPAK